MESSAFIRECYERGNQVDTPTGFAGVWLDSPMVDAIHGAGTIEHLRLEPGQFGQVPVY